MAVKHKFTVYGDPRGKGRPRFSFRSGHAYTDKATAEYEAKIRKMWRSENLYRIPFQPTTIIINAFFRVPKSIPKKSREALFDTDYLKKPDCDNIAKVVLDALNLLAYEDDRQINCLLVHKRYVKSDADEPRIEIQIIGGEL